MGKQSLYQKKGKVTKREMMHDMWPQLQNILNMNNNNKKTTTIETNRQRKLQRSTDLGWRGTPWRGTAHGGSGHRRPLPVLADAAGVSLVLHSAGGELSGRAAPGWGGPWWSSHTVCSSRHMTPDCTHCPASASAVDRKRRDGRGFRTTYSHWAK